MAGTGEIATQTTNNENYEKNDDNDSTEIESNNGEQENLVKLEKATEGLIDDKKNIEEFQKIIMTQYKEIKQDDADKITKIMEDVVSIIEKEGKSSEIKTEEIKKALHDNMELLTKISNADVTGPVGKFWKALKIFFTESKENRKNKSKEKTIVTVFFTDTNDDKKILSRTTEIYKNEISSISDIISMLSNTIEDVELGLKAIHRGARNDKKNLTTRKFSRSITSDGKITADGREIQTVFDGKKDLVAEGELTGKTEDNTDYSEAIKILQDGKK